MTEPCVKTTLHDQIDPKCVRRPYKVVGRLSVFGRSSVIIQCPFCHDEFTAYVWSLPNGKRCGSCGAMFGARGEAWKMPAS